jgi:putative hemolysin
MLADIAVLLALILLNGLFSMSELALISSRRARLHGLAEQGRPGAARALALSAEPTRFLSTVQVGITSIGILTGAIGEAGLAAELRAGLEGVPALAPHAEALALVLMVLLVTYASLIVGELVPKRLAMLRPESIAVVIARPMHALAVLAQPLVRLLSLLSLSTEGVLVLLRVRRAPEPSVTEEEIRVLMRQGAEEGVFVQVEQRLVENILALDIRRVGSVMTPRVDVAFLDLEEPFEVSRQRILERPQSEFPLCRDGIENVVGVVRSKALLERLLRGETVDLAALAEPPLFVPESVTLIQLLEHFRRAHLHTAIVVDEYGDPIGLVSLYDVLAAIVGELPSGEGPAEPLAVEREDGSWLVDGLLDLHELKRLVGVEALPEEAAGQVQTVSGLVMLALGRVPQIADTFEAAGLRFEVVDMDRHRVDRVLVSRIPPPPPTDVPEGPA